MYRYRFMRPITENVFYRIMWGDNDSENHCSK